MKVGIAILQRLESLTCRHGTKLVYSCAENRDVYALLSAFLYWQ